MSRFSRVYRCDARQRIHFYILYMQNNLNIDSTGFDRMMRTLTEKTGGSYEKVLKSMAGEVLSNAARKTIKADKKEIDKSIRYSLATRFVSSSGDKIRKAIDGSLVYRSKSMRRGHWIRLRRDFKLNAISAKNPSGAIIKGNLKKSINRALAEFRKRQKDILALKKGRTASSQATFLEIMRKPMLRIPLINSRGLGLAQKSKLTSNHVKALSGKFMKSKEDAAIIIRSRSDSALNPRAKGINAFAGALNGKVMEFNTALSKDLKGYVKEFSARNGFTVK